MKDGKSSSNLNEHSIYSFIHTSTIYILQRSSIVTKLKLKFEAGQYDQKLTYHHHHQIQYLQDGTSVAWAQATCSSFQ